MWKVVLVCVIVWVVKSTQLRIEELDSENENEESDIDTPKKVLYELTSGSSIATLERSLYTEEEFMLFIIPILPEMEQLRNVSCAGYSYIHCLSLNDTRSIIQDTYAMHQLLRQMISPTGLKAVEFATDGSPDVLEEAEFAPIAKIVGTDWYKAVSAALENKAISPRNKRGVILPILARAGISAAPMFLDVMKNLFTSKKDVLLSLLSTKLVTPKRFLPFLKFANTMSEIASLEWFGEKDIQLKQEGIFERLQNRNKSIFDTVYGDFMHEIVYTMSDVSSLLYQSLVFSVHSQALSACRANEIPISFVSPNQVSRKLEELEQQLPKDLQLVWPVDDAIKYFKSDSARCSFYESGGIVAVSVPLKPSTSNFVLYRFQGLSFRLKEQTCDFDLPSTYIIKDLTTSSVYPITDLDEDMCSPQTQQKCRVPAISTADTQEHMCVRAILTEAPVSVLKKVCHVSCRDDVTVLPVQISDTAVVVTNLPKDGAQVRCGNEVHPVHHDVDIGAVQVSLRCGCKLLMGNKVLGQSFSKTCTKDLAPFTLVCLVPAQWTTLENWQSQPHDRDLSTGMRFDSLANLMDIDSRKPAPVTVSGWVQAEFYKASLVTTLGQFTQFGVTVYILCRLRGIDAALAYLGRGANGAGGSNTCSIPIHVEILLYAILILLIVLTLPKVVNKIITWINETWFDAVNRAAVRISDA